MVVDVRFQMVGLTSLQLKEEMAPLSRNLPWTRLESGEINQMPAENALTENYP